MASILVADNDVQFRSMLFDVLRSAGHTIIMASDGYEAVRLIQESDDHSPALIIITQETPAITEADLVRTLRRQQSTRGAPILLLTKTTESPQGVSDHSGMVRLCKTETTYEEVLDIVNKMLRAILPPAQPLPAPIPFFLLQKA